MPAAITPILTWNHQPLAITAKVDALINATDYLAWAPSFMPALIPDPWSGENPLPFDGATSTCAYGDQYLSSGLWRFTVTDGACDAEHPIALFMNPDQPDQTLFATLTAVGEPVELTIPPQTEVIFRPVQSSALAPATVTMIRIAYFADSGYPPDLVTSSDTFTARWTWTPRPGVLTATAHIYDGNGFLLASSAAITLTITDSNSDGGGS